MTVYDLIGIGFGPSNIALAIALQEHSENGHHIDTLFVEKQPDFGWHKDMLLDGTNMQISFLKDLATLHNPRSHFTFTNYLFEKGRLQDFINLKTFYPSRHEFNDYLTWAARQFDHQCDYNEEITSVVPEKHGKEVSLLRIISRDATGKTQERLTRNLVLGVGGSPNIPSAFQPVQDDPRVTHSSQYLGNIDQFTRAKKIALIGAGQSAAEIFLDLHGRPNAPEVDLIMRGHAMHPADSSPSVNEIFNVELTDYFYNRPQEERANFLNEFRHTNYSAPDIEQIEHIFNILYAQKVTGCPRHRLLTRHETQKVTLSNDKIQLQLTKLDGPSQIEEHYDAVILATGYQRNHHKTLLQPLAPYLSDFEVDRQYRLSSTPDFKPTIFIQGACEATHGISDTLLSIIATRSHEIIETLVNTQINEVTHLSEKVMNA